MNEQTKWFSVMWKNWRTPDEDQRFTCRELTGQITFNTYEVLRITGNLFIVVDAQSEEEACDKAGKIFDKVTRTSEIERN